MPIFLDNTDELDSSSSVKTYSPKFFDTKLTGKGGTSTVGVLSANSHPIAAPAHLTTDTSQFGIDTKQTKHNGNTTVYRIPINSLPYDIYDYLDNLPVPNLNDLTLIAENKQKKYKMYLSMKVTAITIEETSTTSYVTGQTSISRKVTPCYQLIFYTVKDNNITVKLRNSSFRSMCASPRYNSNNEMAVMYSSNPLKSWNDTYEIELNQYDWTTYTQDFIDFISNFDTHDSVTKSSEEWQTEIDKRVEYVFKNLKNDCYNNKLKTEPLSVTGKVVIRSLVKYLMNYNIPLELYKNIYAAVAKYFPADVKYICKHNLNLLLSNTLNNLSANKANLTTFKAPANMNIPLSITKLSMQQINAIKCEEPLVLVQAGAGTGKSTLILARIEYLIASGVNANDITVLSFTNAAADNITAKNPNVNSMTIARMIHEIYTNNYTGHELSSLDTILNSLDIYYPPQSRKDSFMSEFASRIRNVIKNESNNFTEMNNFIKDNYDKVIETLDTIGQTSLELEIMICYQKIDVLNEPSSVQSKFLIIDEVQDNSVFEFIYTLKYIDKHQQSMFIVGDCSQTLYEFRASNPRALNILEGSGTFEAFQLTTNYRSNQEILDMANIMLQTIEANQYAQIQLKANSRAKVTEQSFLEKVHFNYQRLNKINDLHDQLPSIFARQLHKYIKDCLAKKEQIAILAYTRRDIAKINEILTMQYPNTNIVSLVPKKMFNSTVISSFIKNYWSDIKFAPTVSIVNLIIQEIMLKLQFLTYNPQKAAPAIRDMLNKWKLENNATIQVWVNQFLRNQMTHDALLDNIKRNLLQFEISTNAMKQALLSVQNQQNKESAAIENANFLLSTIHSAKGLEFDNVIVLYKNENQMDEEKKRMYYVALTRAMKSEYILAYDTMVSPQIEADYLTVLESLHAQSPAPNSPFNSTPKNKINI